MGTPFKMKAGKEGPMKKNFSMSPMKQNTVENFMKVANKVTRAKGGKVSFKSAWEAMDAKAKAKHGNFETFKGAAKKFNKENPNYDKSKHGTRKHKDGTRSIL
tara:strand:+ start:558 stop:866 length:309 start_codon:yes stop_codon:yes gene_type:complete